MTAGITTEAIRRMEHEKRNQALFAAAELFSKEQPEPMIRLAHFVIVVEAFKELTKENEILQNKILVLQDKVLSMQEPDRDVG